MQLSFWLLKISLFALTVLADSEKNINSNSDSLQLQVSTHRHDHHHKSTVFYFSIPSYHCSAHFRAGLLETLNDDRAARGWAPLVESKDMTFEAQAWALTNARLGDYRPADPRFGQYLFNAANDPKLKDQIRDYHEYRYSPEMVFRGALQFEEKEDWFKPKVWEVQPSGEMPVPDDGDDLELESKKSEKINFESSTLARYWMRSFTKQEYRASSKVGFGCSTFKSTANASAGSLTVVFFDYHKSNYDPKTASKSCWDCGNLRPLNKTDPSLLPMSEGEPSARDSCDHSTFTLPVPTLNANDHFFRTIQCIINTLRLVNNLEPLTIDRHLSFRALEWATTGGNLGKFRLWDFNFGQAIYLQNDSQVIDESFLNVDEIIESLTNRFRNGDFRPQLSTFDWDNLKFKMRDYSDEEWANTRRLGLGVSTLYNIRHSGMITTFLVLMFDHPDYPEPVPTPPPTITTTKETPIPTPNSDPNIISLPIPLSDHCPAKVEQILLKRMNKAREKAGLQPLLNDGSDLTADAQEFSALHLNSSVWSDSKFKDYGMVRWEEYTSVKGQASSVSVNVKGVADLFVYQFPPNKMSTNESYSENEWAEMEVVGFGCRFYFVDDSDKKNADQKKVNIVIVAFFDQYEEEITTTSAPTLLPNPKDPDPLYIIPQDVTSCPPGLVDHALRQINGARAFKNLPLLDFDPGLTSDLAQDFTNHHFSRKSFYNTSFIGYGYDGLRLWYSPAPPGDEPLRVHLKYELIAIATEVITFNPSRMGERWKWFTDKEWALTKVVGFGCTAWPSGWPYLHSNGSDDGESGGKGIIIAPKVYDAFTGKEFINSTLSKRPASASLGCWKSGVNLALVAFFKSPWAAPTTTTITTTTTTTTPTTPTPTPTTTPTTTTTKPTTTTTTTTKKPTTTTTTTTKKPTTTPATTTTTTSTPSTTTVSPTPLPGSFYFPVPSTKSCPNGFPNYLLGVWNVVRLKDNMRELKINKKAMTFGQRVAFNVSIGEQIIFRNFRYGALNYTAKNYKSEQTIYGNAIEMVTLTNGNMPVTMHSKFSYDEWVNTKFFGVGCSAFINPKNETELFIEMLWAKPAFSSV